MKNPAVVIVAYNRPGSLARLLNSLSQADYENSMVPLVISLDGGAAEEVIELAETFEWAHGEKRLIRYKRNLGLREHVLMCGRLTGEFDAVIILEDDLVVGPQYYSYSLASLNHCETASKVAGISLFGYQTKEFKHLPFIPLEDGFDNYYLQVPSSWGQIWVKDWWTEFENWLQVEEHDAVRLPTPVSKWGDQSWKKSYMQYLVENDLYFFYPRVSHTTNFGDAGVNNKGGFARYQVPLQMGSKLYGFSFIEESTAVYDVYFEWTGLKEEKYQSLEFDLYGEKQSFLENTQFVLTTRGVRKTIESFGVTMLPLEANYIHKLEGKGINLARKEDVDMKKRPMNPAVHERLVGKYSKQRYWIHYWRTLKEAWGL
ncbi:MAG: hypothetical protein CMP48_07665 [Rickettsiales bacterium]|nr:hypothetical protein [Rickettsiales bacterium]